MKHNWEEIAAKALEMVEADGKFETKTLLAEKLGLPQRTVGDALDRGDLDLEALVESEYDGEEDDIPDDAPVVNYALNDAVAKFKSTERISPDELTLLAGIDTTEFKRSRVKANVWPLGRADKKKEVHYAEGGVIAEGSYSIDTGEINTKYMWQMTCEYERINRIAVNPVMQPIEIKPGVEFFESIAKYHRSAHVPDGWRQIVHWTDGHFGYRGDQPVHDQEFIAALLWLIEAIRPDEVINTGDTLDLPDLSRWLSTPDEMFHTQRSAIECAWVLAQMRPHCRKFTNMEGNHDIRMRNALAQNMIAGYDLKPVHDLSGPPLMSVPRLLGLAEMDMDWVSDYERGRGYRTGNAKFFHGNRSSSGTAKTVSLLGNKIKHNFFFGHIHRYEIGSGYDEWTDTEYFIASPGSACTNLAPGAKDDSDWQVGAFVITLDEKGEVADIERLRRMPNGKIVFRGAVVDPGSYVPQLNADIAGTGYSF